MKMKNKKKYTLPQILLAFKHWESQKSKDVKYDLEHFLEVFNEEKKKDDSYGKSHS